MNQINYYINIKKIINRVINIIIKRKLSLILIKIKKNWKILIKTKILLIIKK
jgi:hypothetical protein